jgi:hypothetical protein
MTMASSATSRLKAAITALLEPFTPTNATQNIATLGRAHRVGPQRVILKIDLNRNFAKYEVDHVTINNQQLQFDLRKADNENVIVSLVDADQEVSARDKKKRDHRVTLKVKPQTSSLTLTFSDKNSKVYKTEQIKIG